MPAMQKVRILNRSDRSIESFDLRVEGEEPPENFHGSNVQPYRSLPVEGEDRAGLETVTVGTINFVGGPQLQLQSPVQAPAGQFHQAVITVEDPGHVALWAVWKDAAGVELVVRREFVPA